MQKWWSDARTQVDPVFLPTWTALLPASQGARHPCGHTGQAMHASIDESLDNQSMHCPQQLVAAAALTPGMAAVRCGSRCMRRTPKHGRGRSTVRLKSLFQAPPHSDNNSNNAATNKDRWHEATLRTCGMHARQANGPETVGGGGSMHSSSVCQGSNTTATLRLNILQLTSHRHNRTKQRQAPSE
jgi:hypothetical protein